jgi:hypothetical protein
MAKKRNKIIGYKKRTDADNKVRENKVSTGYLSLVKTPAKLMKNEERKYRLRFLYATWEGATHFGIDADIHRNAGVDRDRVISRASMGHKDDALRDYIQELKAEGKKRAADDMYAGARVLYYVVDLDNPLLGVQVMEQPQKADRALAKACRDPETGETLHIDDPEEGHVVIFYREKNDGGFAENQRFQVIGRREPLSDDPDQMDEWLEFISEHPLPTVLNVLENDELERMVAGMKAADPSSRTEDEEEDTDPAPRTRSRARRPEPEPEEDTEPDEDQEPIDDDDEDLDQPAPKTGGLRKRRPKR